MAAALAQRTQAQGAQRAGRGHRRQRGPGAHPAPRALPSPTRLASCPELTLANSSAGTAAGPGGPGQDRTLEEEGLRASRQAATCPSRKRLLSELPSCPGDLPSDPAENQADDWQTIRVGQGGRGLTSKHTRRTHLAGHKG